MADTINVHDAALVQLSVVTVSAFVSNNPVPAADLPTLIGQVHATFVALSMPVAAPMDVTEKATPAQIRKSITPNALISFIDGKPYKTLKRHVSTHGLTFAAYRERYGLPDGYPTVSVNYSAARSALAKEFGLGQQRHHGSPPASANTSRRGRPRKSAQPAAAELAASTISR